MSDKIEEMTKVRKLVKDLITLAKDNNLSISIPVKPFEKITKITIDLTENDIKFN